MITTIALFFFNAIKKKCLINKKIIKQKQIDNV